MYQASIRSPLRICSHQCVLVDGLGSGEDPEAGPDLVQQVLTDLTRGREARWCQQS